MKEIILASPRGFCAGVDRAVSAVETALEHYPPPIYVKHEIVHNRHVVDNLKRKGVIFVEEVSEVPNGQTLIFSAHGVSPQTRDEAKERNLNVIDATCPLVAKVHLEARRYSRDGYTILLVGHKNHVETIGTFGEAPENMIIVETRQDAENLVLPADVKVAVLTQTTLSVFESREIVDVLREKFPDLEMPKSGDICYATTNRQEAVSQMARGVDILLVLGSANSSNSNRLRELGESLGARSYLIDSAEEIEDDWFKNEPRRIGITSGASAPEVLVQETLHKLRSKFGYQNVKEVQVTEENISFALPKELKILK